MVKLADMPSDKKKPGRRKSPDSKRSQGVDRHQKPRKAFHAEPELFAALEDYIEATRPRPDLSECLRTALEEFLQKRGFWPPKNTETPA
jgi:hypothetical protein